MIWPVIIAIMVYIIGAAIQEYQTRRIVKLSMVFGSVGIMSLGLVGIGLLDMISYFAGMSVSVELAVAEIAGGVALSILSSFFKDRMTPKSTQEAVGDGVQ